MKNRKGDIDRPFLITLILLLMIGLLAVFSASIYSSTVNGSSGYSLFLKQFFFAGLGVALMYVISRVNFRILANRKFSLIFYAFSLILLILVLIPGIGVKVNDARRWLNVGVQFQPSEIAKIAGIIYMCTTVERFKQITKAPLGLNPGTVQLYIYGYGAIGLLVLVTALEPSMSAALVIGLGMLMVLYYAGVRFSQFIPFGFVGIAGILYLLKEPWRASRIYDLFSGNTNYQIAQSLLAFGSGGIFGVGLGNGRQKLLFLPEIQNDFIFAHIGEEFGLFGCLVVIALYSFLIYRGFCIGLKCKNRFGHLYTMSMMTLLAYQVLVNIGVAIKIYPVTGMALPFISYGGTSMIILLCSIGPILNISRSTQLGIITFNQILSKINEYINRFRRNRRSHLSRNRHRAKTQKRAS